MTRVEIGAVMQAIRIKKGYKQGEVAKLLGRANSTLAMWETGRSQPDINTLIELFRLYGESLDEVFGLRPPSDVLPAYGIEKQLILAYHSHPDMQPAVRKVLDLDDVAPSDHADHPSGQKQA